MGNKYKKADIVEFIEKVRNKAILSVDKEYQAKISERKLEILEEQGILGSLKELEATIKKTIDKHMDLAVIMQSNENIKYRPGEYQGPESKLNSVSDYLNRVIDKCSFADSKMVELVNEYDAKRNGVIANYKTVSTTVNSMGSAKKMIEYLSKLGFDVSYIPFEAETTALVNKVNTSMLFVCGENK